MCEIPSNVILAQAFAERFEGFSIGSNDLTQLTLGVDRDSDELAEFFDETAALASRNLVRHSGPGRLARPYPVEDLHLLSFASFPGALRSGSIAVDAVRDAVLIEQHSGPPVGVHLTGRRGVFAGRQQEIERSLAERVEVVAAGRGKDLEVSLARRQIGDDRLRRPEVGREHARAADILDRDLPLRRRCRSGSSSLC
jgi:hypothetical protein